MRQTLVLIPHELSGLPVFGFGWLLILLAVGLCVRLANAVLRRRPLGRFLATEGLMWGLAATVVAVVLPRVELTNISGDPVGMAIRGYGVMLLLGVVSSVALAAYRASRRGIDPDVIYSMAPWAFIGGIGGARLFYVIQYWDKFQGDSAIATLGNMLKFTEGGLVVYGSFIGGAIAVAYYIFRHRLPLLTFGDVIVPCLFIGVFFGRIGCFMNGCCYGGRCEEHWASVRFPPVSMVYQEQMASGELLGMTVDKVTNQIEAVTAGSLAATAGIQPGSTLQSLRATPPRGDLLNVPAAEVARGVVAEIDGRAYHWSPEELPERALPVYAAQLLSSFSSGLLCLILCCLSLLFTREGAIMMIGFASYAVLRFVLELVRVDESGQFGTGLTISQWVSIVVFLLCMIGLVYVYRRSPSIDHAQSRSAIGSGTMPG